MRFVGKRFVQAGTVALCLVCLIITSINGTITIDDNKIPLGGGEKQAFYYLNINNLDYENIDYKQCQYFGKGTVIVEEVEVKKTVTKVQDDTSLAKNGEEEVREVNIDDTVDTDVVSETSDVQEAIGSDTTEDNSVETEDMIEDTTLNDASSTTETVETNEEIVEDTDQTEGDYNENVEDETSNIDEVVETEEEVVEEIIEIKEVASVGQVPAYDGSLGRVTFEWEYIAFINGNYRVFGKAVPEPNIETEQTAFYYLNNTKVDLDEVDYKKCYYVGKGTVIEEENYKGVIENRKTGVIPEYKGDLGRLNISWDKIEYVNDNYRVYGTISEADNIQVEKPAFYYINHKKLEYDSINYKQCIYVGKGSVYEEEDYKGNIVNTITGNVPTYKNLPANSEIIWEEIQYSSGNYRVYGNIISTIKKTEFETVEELKKAENLEVGDVVTTKGYYAAGDGGAATYIIGENDNYPENDNRYIKLENGLYAVLKIENDTIIVNQIGAYGDGVHDDVNVIQKIVDLGLNVELVSNKTYKFISNGIYLTNDVSITGNNATILVDDSYSPTISDFEYYLIRNVYGTKLDKLSIDDLNININFSDDRILGREFVPLSPLWIKNIKLQGVNIETSKTHNCVDCLWINNGCDSIVIDNCKFINNTSGETGGALWLTSKDNIYNTEYNSIKSCKISNTYVYCSSADEPFAVWGVYDANVDIDNTTIQGDIIASGQTRIFSVFCQGDNSAQFDINVNNSKIIGNCSKETTNSFYDSFIGVGTDYASNSLNVTFNNTDITGTVYGSLIFPSLFRSENIERYDGEAKSTNISFKGCNIDCRSTITGTGVNYYNTSAKYPANAWDCTFDNCNIKCQTVFAYLYMTGNGKYYIPEIVLNNCDVTVDDAKAFIYRNEKSAGVNLKLNNTDITASGVTNLIKTRSSKTRTLLTQNNSSENIECIDSTFNGTSIE